jgi:hypothetical protein
MMPRLEERLMDSSEAEVALIAYLVCPINFFAISIQRVRQIKKGASSARSDDTKSLKGAILDWITPREQPSTRRYLGTSRLIVVSTMNVPVPCYALLNWIGLTPSAYSNALSLASLITPLPVSRKSCAAESHP